MVSWIIHTGLTSFQYIGNIYEVPYNITRPPYFYRLIKNSFPKEISDNTLIGIRRLSWSIGVWQPDWLIIKTVLVVVIEKKILNRKFLNTIQGYRIAIMLFRYWKFFRNTIYRSSWRYKYDLFQFTWFFDRFQKINSRQNIISEFGVWV